MASKWWTLIAVCTGVFMLLLDITIVNVALPDIQRDLDASLSDLQWVIDAYALTLAALLLTAGSLADRYGRKLLFAIGTLVFTIGSLLCGLAPTVQFLTFARAGQGIGGAIMFATATPVVAPKKAKAVPRSLPLNAPDSSASAVANMIAPPIPWPARAKVRNCTVGASPHSSEPIVKTRVPIANSSLRP